MQVNQIENFINSISPSEGHKTVVTFLNSASFYGFFVRFSDWKGLKKKNEWRFIPIHKFPQFDYELRKNNFQNPEYSIIIDGNVISNLEIIPTYSLS